MPEDTLSHGAAFDTCAHSEDSDQPGGGGANSFPFRADPFQKGSEQFSGVISLENISVTFQPFN